MTGHPSYRISLMDTRHAADVAALEELCFPGHAWNAEQYRHAVADDPAFAGFVCALPDSAADCAGQGIAGYMACYHTPGELEILNVAVHPRFRGRGVATSLMQSALQWAGQAGIVRCCLEVRSGNVPALRLYGSAGFAQAGLRRRYYSDTGEDALVMVRESQ